jgi:primosomal protein N' (replication factor Y) (superfamily II helicase)
MTLLENELQDSSTYFAEIILPLAVGNTFTYRIPQTILEEVIPGKRALVPFGIQKTYAGLIFQIHSTAPKEYEAKYLYSVLDAEPIIGESQLNFWQWIAEYYCCHLGEVMKAALPSGLKLESESYLVLMEDESTSDLTSREQLILDLLRENGEIKLSDLAKMASLKSVLPLVKSLLKKNRVQVREDIGKGYIPKKQSYIRLSPRYNDPIYRKQLFDELEKKPNQLTLIIHYLQLMKTVKEVSKVELLKNYREENSSLELLIKKGIFEKYLKRVSRLEIYSEPMIEIPALSSSQKGAFEEIKTGFTSKDVLLLHGITSSGKTQIYIQLVVEYLALKKQVLYLLPEIALTSQLVHRLRKQFGDQVGIYHSLFNENERVETWEKVLKGEFSIIIGARSSLFLPFKNLGLIIIDEEHEPSFKQYDPAPRYHARDAAIYLGMMQKAKVLLGSATPSIESYYHAKQGKYGFVSLNERFGGVASPEIKLVDLKIENKEKKLKFHFSQLLIQEIDSVIVEKEQTILFQNRRGYSPLLLCKACGFIPKCIHCDVSLTLHKSTQKLHCHYCGYRATIPPLCPVCGDPEIQDPGLGTEKIEEELKILYPQLRVARMDLDTTRGKNGHWKIVSDLEENKIDILVGTQMVSKGLDFGKVQLIGVMNADQLLNFPDFRSFERGFQILTQVSGRAGRRAKQGKVIIQTYTPKHPVLSFIVQGNYQALYEAEIFERNKFNYPPFSRLIKISCKNIQSDLLRQYTTEFAKKLKANFGEMVLGPEEALIPRIRNYFIQEFMLKLPRVSVSPSLVKIRLREIIQSMKLDKKFRNTICQIDVDPV